VFLFFFVICDDAGTFTQRKLIQRHAAGNQLSFTKLKANHLRAFYCWPLFDLRFWGFPGFQNIFKVVRGFKRTLPFQMKTGKLQNRKSKGGEQLPQTRCRLSESIVGCRLTARMRRCSGGWLRSRGARRSHTHTHRHSLSLSLARSLSLSHTHTHTHTHTACSRQPARTF